MEDFGVIYCTRGRGEENHMAKMHFSPKYSDEKLSNMTAFIYQAPVKGLSLKALSEDEDKDNNLEGHLFRWRQKKEI